MVSGSEEFQGGTNPVVKTESQARLQAARDYNAQVQQQRQNAPSGIKSGSPQDTQVRAEEKQDAQQAYFGGGFNKTGSSSDSFAAQREAAIKTGKFDYSAVKSSSYSPPSNFVNNKGERTVRPSEPIQSVVVPEKIVTKTSLPTPTQTPQIVTTKTPVLQISKEELQKSNSLRASQGLPPLESVASVQVVPSTKGPSQIQTATLYGKTFQTFTPKDKDSGVATSFLKTPFSGVKSQTKDIPSTTLLDPLQFAVGGAGKLIKTGGEVLLNALRPTAKTVTKVGTADIGLNLAQKTNKQIVQQRETEAVNNFNRFVEASQNKQVTKVQQAKADRIITQSNKPQTTSQTVNLGTGIGKQIGKDSGTSTLTDKFKPSPPSKPTTPSPKEVTVGKGGLTQIVKEKPPITKTETITKQATQMKEAKINLGSGSVKLTQKPKIETLPKTQAQIKTESYLQSLQKPKPIYKPKQNQAQEIIPIRITPTKPRPQTTPQKQRRTTAPVLIPTPPPPRPRTRTIPTLIPITRTTQKQRQENVGITDLLTTSVTRGKTPPPPPPPTGNPPPPRITEETPPPTKRNPPFGGLLGNGINGGLGKVSKSGAAKGYIGNVPLSSLVGIYNRSEVSYGGSSGKSSRPNSKTNFSKLGSQNKNRKLI